MTWWQGGADLLGYPRRNEPAAVSRVIRTPMEASGAPWERSVAAWRAPLASGGRSARGVGSEAMRVRACLLSLQEMI